MFRDMNFISNYWPVILPILKAIAFTITLVQFILIPLYSTVLYNNHTYFILLVTKYNAYLLTLKRRGPTGGAAYGTPRYSSTSFPGSRDVIFPPITP